MAEKIVKDSQSLAKDLVNDCISRQAAIDEIMALIEEPDNDFNEGVRTSASVIYKLPSAQPERKRGRWIPNIYPDVGDGYRCSQCGTWHVVKYNFCHNCGADMREADDERPD